MEAQPLTELDALRAYARMLNNLDVTQIESLLDDKFRYSSQWMVGEFSSKQEYLDYIIPELLSVKQSGGRIYAEIAIIEAWGHDECVVTSEGEIENFAATVFAFVKGDKITRIDMCCMPHPLETMRTGEYPS